MTYLVVKWLHILSSTLLFGTGIGLQMRMRDIAQVAAREGAALPREYWLCFRYWTILGFPAFIAFLTIFYLMVFRPT